MSLRLVNRVPFVGLLVLGLLVATALHADEGSQERMKRDVTFLASDECEGRGIGTMGLERAAEYVANLFKEAGLKPGGVDGTYFQPFPVMRGSEKDGTSTLVLKGPYGQTITLRAGTDFEVSGLAGAGKVTAPLVFVGFGVTAKAAGYDDYAGVDVKGKVVLALRRVPRWSNEATPFDGPRKNQHAEFENKQALASVHEAAALILVNDLAEQKFSDGLQSFNVTSRTISNFNLPFLQIRRPLAEDMLFSSLGQSLTDVEQAINRDLKPRSAPLTGWTATLDVKVKRTTLMVKNVIGVLEGSGPLANETIVIGAHYDHVGYGGPGSGSLAPKVKNAIHHGADDNGSGTTAMIELARRFAAQKNRQGRRLVFMAFTAEESGLIGSRYYCKRQPLFPLKDTVAMVNLDMVGRLRPDAKSGKDKVQIEGSGSAKSFDAMLEKLNPGFQLVKQASGNGPSDHASFYSVGIPVVFMWTGYHPDYHRPTDTADKINVAGMDRIVDYAEKVIATINSDARRPEYVEVASKFAPGTGMGKMPRLGITPDYESEKVGVLISAVSSGGPAEQAGLKAGDLIVGIGGRPVSNINTYMTLMGQQKAGTAIEVLVMRDGQQMLLKVVPQN
jgi:hypothetical protein